MLTNKEIGWIIALTKEAAERTPEAKKKSAINSLTEKLQTIQKDVPQILTSQKDIEGMNKSLAQLHELALAYSESTDISSLEVYDRLKKDFIPHLEYLSTLKDKFAIDADYLNEYIKKELRGKLTEQYKSTLVEQGDKPSVAAIDRMIETDETYLLVNKQCLLVEGIAQQLKTKYDLYLKLWQMIFQSCSTASKSMNIQSYQE